MLGEERLERAVLGLKPDPAVALTVEGLDGRLVGSFVFADERDDDVTLARVVLPMDDDDVAVEDSGVDHRLALHAKEEVGVPAERLGDGDSILDLLLGEHRPACGDSSHEGEQVGFRMRAGGVATRPAYELECARLRRVATEKSRAFQVREVRVHGGRGSQPDRIADLTHGRRVAMAVHVLGEELPDLLLS